MIKKAKCERILPFFVFLSKKHKKDAGKLEKI